MCSNPMADTFTCSGLMPHTVYKSLGYLNRRASGQAFPSNSTLASFATCLLCHHLSPFHCPLKGLWPYDPSVGLQSLPCNWCVVSNLHLISKTLLARHKDFWPQWFKNHATRPNPHGLSSSFCLSQFLSGTPCACRQSFATYIRSKVFWLTQPFHWSFSIHLEMGQVFMSHQRYTLIVFNETNLPTKYHHHQHSSFFY